MPLSMDDRPTLRPEMELMIYRLIRRRDDLLSSGRDLTHAIEVLQREIDEIQREINDHLVSSGAVDRADIDAGRIVDIRPGGRVTIRHPPTDDGRAR